MNINTSTSSGVYNNPVINNNKKETAVSRLQKQIIRIDKNIAQIRENQKMDAREKKEKIHQQEEQKQLVLQKINEERIREKMSEVEEKIEKAEEIEAKKKEKEKILTPLDEIKAELGIELSSKSMIKASRALDIANNKFNTAKKMRQDAKILEKQVEADRGRGQNVDMIDFRVKQSISFKSKADRIETEAMESLKKVTQLVKKASEELEKVKEKNTAINKQVEKDEKQEGINYTNPEKDIEEKRKDSIGKNVDIKL
jgi:DNA repair exonuclease SbcCD ATPase subunit